MVIRLGGFHTEMSYLGSSGCLMAGSGLKELLEVVYADNAVRHMLTGKAVSRAVRGQMLVDAALNTILVAKAYNVSTTTTNQLRSDDAERENVSSEREGASLRVGQLSTLLHVMKKR